MHDLSLQRRLGRLEAEILHLLPVYGAINYDDLGATWVYIERFPIGSRWSRSEIEVLVDIPDGTPGYPQEPPTGFWTGYDLTTLEGEPIARFFPQDLISEQGHLQKRWSRFAFSIDHWQPSVGSRFQEGDSLLTFFEGLLAAFHRVW